jgi:hypothetical protein
MHEEMMENAKRQQVRRWEHPWKLLAGSIEQCNYRQRRAMGMPAVCALQPGVSCLC